MSKQYPQFVTDFLEIVLSSTKDKALREEIRVEIISHLQDALERDLIEGRSEEASFRKTISAFGDPKKMSHGFKKAHQVWYLRWVYLVPSMMGITIFAACVAATLYAGQQFKNLSHSFDKDSKLREEIIAGHKQLKALDPFFSKTFTRGRDAGPYLNPLAVRWGVLEFKKKSTPPEMPKELLFKEVYSVYNTTNVSAMRGLDWDRLAQSMRASELKEQLDFSWMKRLHQYDYWDLYLTPGQGRDYLVSHGQTGYSTPSLNSFVLWSKFRLADGIACKDPLAALRDVRKLAELIYSTETIGGTAVALSILDGINGAYEESRRRGLIRSEQWKPIAFNLKDRARLLAWSVNHWSNLFASNEFKAELFRLQPIFGSCAAVNEAAVAAGNLNSFPLVQSPMAFEQNLGLQMREFQDFVIEQQKFCRLTFAKYSLAHPPVLAGPLNSGELGQDLWDATNHIPYLRQYTMAEELSFAPTSWLLAYDNFVKERK